jgi:hypothetical protein
MTMPSSSTDTPISPPIDCVPECVPDCVPESVSGASQGNARSSASQSPPIFDGDALIEPSRDALTKCVPNTPKSASPTRSCHVCGCTDNRACQDMLGDSCWWVGPTLCSACR